MAEIISNSLFFGVAISVFAYECGVWLKGKWKLAIFNPLLISIAAVIVILKVFHIDYNVYNEGAKYLSYFLTPATVCLAVPLYEQVELLKKKYGCHTSRDFFRCLIQRNLYLAYVHSISS